jgi:hypothetical protein
MVVPQLSKGNYGIMGFFSSFCFHFSDKHTKRDVALNDNQHLGPVWGKKIIL